MYKGFRATINFQNVKVVLNARSRFFQWHSRRIVKQKKRREETESDGEIERF